ncbi:hypothetical protein F5X98DRAFT_359871 [Xylaria grammica]|nr:hypothetical protein F5X98DRAFT_359871 [Xylaria grammica]
MDGGRLHLLPLLLLATLLPNHGDSEDPERGREKGTEMGAGSGRSSVVEATEISDCPSPDLCFFGTKSSLQSG